MATSSQNSRKTPVHSQITPLKMPIARPPIAPPSDYARPTKKPRLTPKTPRTGKENVIKASEELGKDEKALMDDLLSGLDASIFDGFGSSPVQSKVPSQKVWSAVKRSPLKVEGELVSPVKIRKRVLQPIEIKVETLEATSLRNDVRSDRLLSDLGIKETKMEIKSPQGPEDSTIPRNKDLKSKAVGRKEEYKVERAMKDETLKLEDEEMFEFDFDMADLASFDEETLLKQAETKIRYPILHPDVPSPPAGYSPTPWKRFKIIDVMDGLVNSEGSTMIPVAGSSTSIGKTLVVSQPESDTRRIVHLKERWADGSFKKGDIINIISPSLSHNDDPKVPLVITFKDPQTYLIHHPDLMLTMTSIANAMPCPRKPILQSLIKVPGPPSKAILYGTIQHSLLQGALSDQSFDIGATRKRIDEELSKESTRLDVWAAGMDLEEVRIDLTGRAGKGFQVFGDKWVGDSPKPSGELHSTPGEEPSLLSISGLHDVEEDIWSPKWGLKGKVDASIQASIFREIKKGTKVTEEHVGPLEIKTGRAVGVMAHRAQTMLYTLLMEDRYGVPVPAGLLYYSQLDSLLRVEAKGNEIRALIIARNELAGWLAKKRRLQHDSIEEGTPIAKSASADKPDPLSVADVEDTFLPPTIDNTRECKSCYAVDSCMLYRKVLNEAPLASEDPISELFEEKAGHLSAKDSIFFNKWETLLTIEEQDTNRFRSQLWTLTSKQREKTGRCFSDMIISSYSNDLGKSLAKIHRHTYTFIKDPTSSGGNTSLLSGHIAKGDPVNLSIEPDLLCLSRGFVLDLTPDQVSIGVTYVIDTSALLKRTSLRHSRKASNRDGGEEPVRFRIDKDEMTSGIMRMRNNLAQLFFTPNGDEKRRKLIVDLHPPYFEIARSLSSTEIPNTLNEDQKNAMNKVMMARDYALILGMPGTGKTTTIAEIIKALVERGKSVLLTSYTHSAVDTILMKLVNAEFGILRLGNVDKVHPDVQHLTLEAMNASKDMQQLDQRLLSPPVVAATCLAIDHPLFFRRKFDYCLVDEASQITLPTCLGPIRMADTFVLVGDHFQLPPIVRNPDARKGGLDVSLFKLLSDAHPEAVVDLSHQYRMNEDIMLLSNRLIYENRLKCGNETVAKQSLVLPNLKPCVEIYSHGHDTESCWIQDLMKPDVKAVFVDTDLVPAKDSKAGDLVQNVTEANLVYQLATALTSSGLPQQDLAILTPYRQQIKLLSNLLQTSLPLIEILTADKSQGRDKPVIIISLVRSNDSGYIGDLLKDWRRINVSFTRAKCKLVIFGSRRTLGCGDKLLGEFIGLMEEKGWIYTLSKGADGSHEMREAESKKSEVDGNKPSEKKDVVDSRREGNSIASAKKAGLSERVMNNRPFGRDILNEING